MDIYEEVNNMNNELLYGIGGIVVGGLIVWAAMSNSFITTNRSMMGTQAGSRAMMQNSNTMDAHFIEQMIPHHEDAITMSKLAETNARTDEVKQLSKSIIVSQSKEIEQMKQWYKEWFGKEVPTGTQVMRHHGMMNNNGMHMGMMGDDTDITRLENAEDFDRVFVEEMIPHHQMAVMMASMLKNGTQRPEMKQLADDIITAQTREIDQMRQWLKDWNR